MLWTTVMVSLFALIMVPGIPYWLCLLPFFAVFLLGSIFYPALGLLIVAFTHNFTGLVRWKAPNALLLAGFGTILISLFLVGFVTNRLINRRPHTRSEHANWWAINGTFLVWLLFVTMIFLNIIAYWNGPVSTLMMFREYIIPLLLLPATVSMLSDRPRNCKWALLALFLGSAIVALVSIVHYAVGLPIHFPRWVTLFNPLTGSSTDIVNFREIFGLQLPRMQHLLGLSSDGAGGVYFMTMAFAGYFLARHLLLQKWRLVLYSGSLVNAVAAVLTLSFSLIVMFACVTTYQYLASILRSRLTTIAILRHIVVGATLILIVLMLNQSISSGFDLIEYIGRQFQKNVIPTLTAFDSFIFGDGLGLKSGGAVGVADAVLSQKHQYINDQWLLVVIYQLGVLGFFLVIAFFLLPLWMSVKVFCRRDFDEMGLLSMVAGIIVAGFIAFMHGAAPIERLFSAPMMITIAVIVVAARQPRKENG